MTVIWTLKVSDPKTKAITEHTFAKNPIFIGRAKEMDLALDNQKISSRHLSLLFKDSRIFVEDLKSTNGAFIYKKGEWQRIKERIRARPPILINAGKAVNIVVKALEQADDKAEAEAPGLDLSRFDGLDANSSFVENIDSAETSEAILVLDLCQSSEIANKDDKMAFHLKKKLNDICEWSFSQYQARFFKSTGDGFLATFEIPASALFAVKQIMMDIKQRNERTTNPPIHVRIALHIGKTYAMEGSTMDIHGNDVNVAFRMEGVSGADFDAPDITLPSKDRILCSEEFRKAVAAYGFVSTTFKFDRVGQAKLKGIQDRVSVFLVEL